MLEVSDTSIHHPGVSVDQIKSAIEQLSFEERAELAAGFMAGKTTNGMSK
jgi:hypothetical protein